MKLWTSFRGKENMARRQCPYGYIPDYQLNNFNQKEVAEKAPAGVKNTTYDEKRHLDFAAGWYNTSGKKKAIGLKCRNNFESYGIPLVDQHSIQQEIHRLDHSRS
jgi:hypothetical protein